MVIQLRYLSDLDCELSEEPVHRQNLHEDIVNDITFGVASTKVSANIMVSQDNRAKNCHHRGCHIV